VKDDALGFELSPAPPKLVRKKAAKTAPPKRKPNAKSETSGDDKD
jgi:hypothetical protein